MKKQLLIILALFCAISASAFDRDSFESYLCYAERIALANDGHEGQLALQAAVDNAYNVQEQGGDLEAELITLKAAVKTFMATATGESPVYVEYMGYQGSLETLQDYGWVFGVTGNSGSNGWNIKNRTEDCGYSVEKWGSSTDSNYAYETLFDLPAGSYTVNVTAGGDADICDIHIIASDGSSNVQDLGGAVQDFKYNFYADSDLDSLRISIEDREGCSGWVAFTNVYVLYAGEEALAPYRSAMNDAIDAADLLISQITEAESVPSGVIATLQSVADKYRGQTFDTQQVYEDATAEIQAVIQDTNDAVGTYGDFLNAVVNANTLIEQGGEGVGELQQVLSDQQAAAAEATTNADLVVCLNALSEAIRTFQYAQASEENPVEIYNSGEITTLNGWITGGTSTGNNGNNLWYVSNRTKDPKGYVMEMWGGKSANYAFREITNAPEGLYELSVMIANSDLCQLYFGGETSDIEKDETGTTVSQEFYMAEAAETLQFGLQSTTATWVAFNNMVLKYKGKDAVAAKRNEFQQTLSDIADYFATLDGLVPEPILTDASDKLLEMDQEYESVEEYQQAIDQAKALRASVEECVELYAELKSIATELREALDFHQNLPDATIWSDTDSKLSQLLQDAAECKDAEELTSVAFELLDLKSSYCFAIASPDEPYIYYCSGDAESLEGWITGGVSDSNNGNNLWYVCTRTTAPVGDFFEMWGSVSTNYAYVEFELPAGLYKMSANIASSETCEFYFQGATYPIEPWGEGQVAESDYFGLGEAATVQFGIQSTTANWVCFNNLTLYYLGSEIPESISQVRSEKSGANKNVFDLTGRRIQSNQLAPSTPSGLYIIGGRKVFVK